VILVFLCTKHCGEILTRFPLTAASSAVGYEKSRFTTNTVSRFHSETIKTGP